MHKETLLHFEFTPSLNKQLQPVLVFIHGLFGDLNNLGVIARAFSDEYPILRLDLRNHGKSFHHEKMDYERLSDDVIRVLEHLAIRQAVLIGHSMGGKTAMNVAIKRPDLVQKLVVIDIAPVNYGEHGHRPIFQALNAVKNARVHTRQEAKNILAQYIAEESIQQFMLKSFDANSPECFRFHLSALEDNYLAIMDWQKGQYPPSVVPCLFIKGSQSDYITEAYQQDIIQQFPQAKAFIIQGTGHWVHAEKPQSVIRAIQQFLQVKQENG